MPIPFLIWAAAAIGLGGSAFNFRKFKRDRDRYNARRKRYERCRERYRKFVESVQTEVDDLHKQRVAAQETLREAAEFLVRAKVKDREFDADFKITPEQFEELKGVLDDLRNLSADFLGTAGIGAGAGILGKSAALALVSALGSTSTGTAIGGLTGAAARSATLAWLGGGSLASGGGGMAAGAAMLANITFIPLAILPVAVFTWKAYKQGKRVDDAIEEMDVDQAKMGRHKAELSALLERVREVSKGVREVEKALKDLLEVSSIEVVKDVYLVWLAAKALAELLDDKSDSSDDEDPGPSTGGGVTSPKSPNVPIAPR